MAKRHHPDQPKQPEATSAHPVDELRAQATKLEAALAVALGETRRSAVHHVRSLARRMEAQLVLLEQLGALPSESPEAAEFARRVRRLRRAAGSVRDLDVQRELLKSHPSLPEGAARKLRRKLKELRARKAAKLQELIGRQLPKVAAAIESVAHSVATSNGLLVPDLRLVALVERWQQTKSDAHAGAEALDDEHLHGVRKAAKLARYMVAGADGSPAAQHAAEHYQRIQEAGGVWHDWLDLAAVARKHLGRKHPLTRKAHKFCERERARFLKLLEEPEVSQE